MDNYIVVYQNLPFKVNGFTLHHACDDFYTIVINSRISHDCAKRTFLHELKHINNNDFHNRYNVNEVETRAHA